MAFFSIAFFLSLLGWAADRRFATNPVREEEVDKGNDPRLAEAWGFWQVLQSLKFNEVAGSHIQI